LFILPKKINNILYFIRYGIHITTLPQQEDVDYFIDEETTMDVLKRWLSAVKIDKLRANNSLIYLNHLVKRAIILNYNIRDIERTKFLNKITQNIAVPSQNSRNYASPIKNQDTVSILYFCMQIMKHTAYCILHNCINYTIIPY
jgi:hypothetical protein